jgi:hypothetical protein
MPVIKACVHRLYIAVCFWLGFAQMAPRNILRFSKQYKCTPCLIERKDCLICVASSREITDTAVHTLQLWQIRTCSSSCCQLLSTLCVNCMCLPETWCSLMDTLHRRIVLVKDLFLDIMQSHATYVPLAHSLNRALTWGQMMECHNR